MQSLYDLIILGINGQFGDISNGLYLYVNDLEVSLREIYTRTIVANKVVK